MIFSRFCHHRRDNSIKDQILHGFSFSRDQLVKFQKFKQYGEFYLHWTGAEWRRIQLLHCSDCSLLRDWLLPPFLQVDRTIACNEHIPYTDTLLSVVTVSRGSDTQVKSALQKCSINSKQVHSYQKAKGFTTTRCCVISCMSGRGWYRGAVCIEGGTLGGSI